MKKLLLPLLAAGICVSASAITADELAKRSIGTLYFGNFLQELLPVRTTGGMMTKKSGNTLRYDNFLEMGIGSDFELDNAGNLTLKMFTGGEVTNGGKSFVYLTSICDVEQYKFTHRDIGTWYQECWVIDQYGSYSTLKSMSHQTLGSIDAWVFLPANNNQYLLVELLEKSTSEPYGCEAFGGFQLYAFETNATAREYQGMMPSDMYNVDLQIAEDGAFTIKNFLNQGMAYDVDPNAPSFKSKWVSGQIDKETGEVVIPVTEVMGDVDFGAYFDGSNYDNFMGYGYLDSSWNINSFGYWWLIDDCSYYPWFLLDQVQGGYGSPIVGTYTAGAGEHSGASRWVTNGGDCTTSVKTVLDLGHAALYSSYYEGIMGEADRTVIETAVEETSDVALTISNGTYNNGNATVGGMLMTKANGEKVDHYDIYVIPGRYNSIYDGGFVIDDQIGNKNAILVYDGTQASDKDYMFMSSFSHNVPNGGDGTKADFTYFVKTNYKAETGLEPTFHALTVAQMTNSAAEIEANEMAQVTAANGVITIAGSDDEVTVYNAAGAVVYQGMDREIPAAAGVYMVRLGNTVKKVAL